MRQSYVEGLASHDGPESCATAGNCRDEVLTGVRAGQVLSREIRLFRVPTLSREAEGNTRRTASARCVSTRRGHRP
jgi:RNA-directed DNA polymerase